MITFIRHNNVESSKTSHRPFGPKAHDHPSIGEQCPACGVPFSVGAITTLVPLGPGEDPESQEKAMNGRWYNALAVECHWSCVTGQSNIEAAALLSEMQRTAVSGGA